MALLKDLIVQGASRFIGDAYFNTIKSGTWNGSPIDLEHGGTAGATTSGLILVSTSTSGVSTWVSPSTLTAKQVSQNLAFSKDGGYAGTTSYNGSTATTISYDSLMPPAAVAFIKANLYTPAVSNNKPANNNALDLSAGAHETVFTVTCKDANGTLMDMASGFPKYGSTSFTKSSTGTYTYTLDETLATLKASSAQALSVSISCQYGGVTKNLSSSRYIKKPSFIFYSATSSYTATTGKPIVDNLLSGTATTGITVATTLNSYSIAGDRTFSITNGQYCYFAVPVYTDATKLSNVKQLGVPWLENTTGVEITTTSWGKYKLFRSKNTGNGKSQTVTLS